MAIRHRRRDRAAWIIALARTEPGRQADTDVVLVVVVRKSASGLTELLARALRDRGREVEVEHLYVHLPRVLKAPASPRTANPEKETAR